MQNVKLSKRQIKEDKFTAFMLNARTQFLENWQFYVIGLVVVVIVIAGSIYLADYQGRRADEAQQKFAQAMNSYAGGQSQVAIVELNSILEDFGGEDAAEQATFLLGRVNLDTRNYPEAIRYYEMFASKYTSNKRNLAAAYAGMATSYENQGDYAQARVFFNKAFEALPDGPMAGDYQYALLRIDLKVGDTAAAEARLKSILDDYEGTDTANKAVRLAAEKGVVVSSGE
jgi:TolA-binding protein